MSHNQFDKKSQAWSALFSEPMSDLVKRYTSSVDFDKRLWQADIAGSLAHKAWADWRKPEMIAQGLTRQRVHDEHQGKVAIVPQRLNNLVYRFMQDADVRAKEAELEPLSTWREDRGL